MRNVGQGNKQKPSGFDGIMADTFGDYKRLVVTEGVGHDSIEATGLLLIPLAHIAHQTRKGTPQLWRLRPPRRTNHSDPWEILREVAGKLGQTADAVYRAERLPG